VLDYSEYQDNEDISLQTDNDSKSYYIIAMNKEKNKENEYIKILTYTAESKQTSEVNANEEN